MCCSAGAPLTAATMVDTSRGEWKEEERRKNARRRVLVSTTTYDEQMVRDWTGWVATERKLQYRKEWESNYSNLSKLILLNLRRLWTIISDLTDSGKTVGLTFNNPPTMAALADCFSFSAC